jgi:hypothetical protein
MQTPRLIVSILTGHGKTLLIQMVANMILDTFNHKTVTIVCLNKFLHSYAELKYARNNPLVNHRLKFKDVYSFFKCQPGENEVVIFDEID